MKNKKILIFMMIFFWIIIPILSWLRYDIIELIDNILISNLLLNTAFVIIVILSLLSIVYVILYAVCKYKERKFKALIPIILLILTILFFSVFPYSYTNGYINYTLFKNSRNGFIQTVNEMFEDEEYIPMYEHPSTQRIISQRRDVIVKKENGRMTALFYVNTGIKRSSAIIYVSDDSVPLPQDFRINLFSSEIQIDRIKKLDNCWYFLAFDN